MTNPRHRVPAGCAEPIDVAILMDYWLGTLPPADEEAIDEHLFACDRCGDRLRETIALAESLRSLARSGSLVVVLSDQFVKHAADTGQRVREYAVPPGKGVQCTVSVDDDLLVARLAAEMSGATRVDLSWCDAQGVELMRMADIPVRRDAGTVICQQSITMAKASPSNTLIARLLSVDREEGERLLGEYAFHHTRTIPGPGRWELP
jgi:hypothetical protein